MVPPVRGRYYCFRRSQIYFEMLLICLKAEKAAAAVIFANRCELPRIFTYKKINMKYLFTLIALSAVLAGNAQAGNLPEWHVGIKGGLNYANISGSGTASGFSAGAEGGVFVERTFNSKWSIQPELLFAQDNTKQSNFSTFYPANYNPYLADDIKLAWLNIPVLFKYNLNHSFSVLAGPQYSYLLKDAESLLSSGDDKAFKHSSFSGNIGAQFNIGRVAVYGRYNAGFSNINNIDTRYTWKANHIQGGLAVRLN